MLVAISLILALFQPVIAAEHLALVGDLQSSESAQVSIFLNEKLEKMAELFKNYERKLKGQGVDAQFLLGAGDLRRAILHQSVDAPGDVEIFVHVPKFKAEPFRLGVFLNLLQRAGVNLKADLRKIYGPKQKLDIFFRDSRFFKAGIAGKPFEPSDDPIYQTAYVGEIGLFDGMGDTTLNALNYWPTENRIIGSPSNIAALREKVIHNLEIEKTRRLETSWELPFHRPRPRRGEAKVKGPPTFYRATLLRMALRSLRAVLDTELTPNPNRLRPGEDLLEVAHGFERYFEYMPDEHFSAFKINEYQAEQFFKVFRNRTQSELTQMRSILERSFPGTLSIWKKLGIDYDVLFTAPRNKAEQRDLENLSVRRNLAFAEISQIIDSKGHITNPFKNESDLTAFVEPNRSSRFKKSEIKLPTQRVLLRLSPRLVAWIQNFDKLNLFDQAWTIKKYIDAYNLLCGGAYERIVKEKSFDKLYGDRFTEVSPAAIAGLQPKSGLTLGEFLDAQIEVGSARKRAPPQLKENVINASSLEQLTNRIANVVSEGKTPILALDLDDVAFLMRDRYLRLLSDYDRVHGSTYFKGLKSVAGNRMNDFLYGYLSQSISDFDELRSTVESVDDYVSDYLFNQETLGKDLANPVISELIESIQTRFGGRVKFVYVSARRTFLTEVTRRAILASGLPMDALSLVGRKRVEGEVYVNIAEEKIEALRQIEKDLGGQVVGFLEDNVRNLEKFESAFPEAAPVRVVYVPLKKGGKTLFVAGDQKVTPLFYGSVGLCLRVLKTAPEISQPAQ